MFSRKVAAAIVVQLLCTCAAKEEPSFVPDVCDSSHWDTQCVQLHEVVPHRVSASDQGLAELVEKSRESGRQPGSGTVPETTVDAPNGGSEAVVCDDLDAVTGDATCATYGTIEGPGCPVHVSSATWVSISTCDEYCGQAANWTCSRASEYDNSACGSGYVNILESMCTEPIAFSANVSDLSNVVCTCSPVNDTTAFKLLVDAPAGSTTLVLNHYTGLVLGGKLTLSIAGLVETVTIVGFGSIIIEEPLEIDFIANETTATVLADVFTLNDPHVASLGGERFDINQPSEYVLLRAPLELSQAALLEFRAAVQPDENKPCGLYVKSVTLSGAWFGDAIVDVRPLKRNMPGSNGAGNMTVSPFSIRFSPESSWKSLADFAAEGGSEALTDMAKVTGEVKEDFGNLFEGQAFSFKIGKNGAPAEIVISQATHQALNLELHNLQALGHKTLGGLLGTEKHSKGVEELTESCKEQKARDKGKARSRVAPDASKLSASWL